MRSSSSGGREWIPTAEVGDDVIGRILETIREKINVNSDLRRNGQTLSVESNGTRHRSLVLLRCKQHSGESRMSPLTLCTTADPQC